MIRIRWRAGLRVRGGKLVAGAEVEVHAASFLRQNLILLDRALLDQPRELRRILIHEIFHFLWWRLGTGKRRVWEALLAREFACRRRGELGWSAEYRKVALMAHDRVLRSRAWREYCCESFCDSGASFFSDARRHPEFTLASTARRERRRVLEDIIADKEHFAELIHSIGASRGGRLPPGLPRLLRLAFGPRRLC